MSEKVTGLEPPSPQNHWWDLLFEHLPEDVQDGQAPLLREPINRSFLCELNLEVKWVRLMLRVRFE